MPTPSVPRPVYSRNWAVIVLATLIVIVGLIIGAGGAYLVSLGGSPYYVAAGVLLVVSGGLLLFQRSEGAILYGVVFLGTIIWAFWEVGANDWALMPRVVGPLLLFILVLLSAPILRPYRLTWPIATTGVIATLVIAAAAGLGIAQHQRSQYAATEQLPTLGSGMADPSPQQVGDNWPAYGGTYAGRRFSPLTQITASNVAQLKRAWDFHTGDLPDARTKNVYGAENTPLKIGDTLYVCTPKNMVIAVDAATGKQKWKFDPKVPDASIPYTADCRGVAYYEVPNAAPTDPCATRIIEGTLDARVIAIDAKTGVACSGFGAQGIVDTTIGIGEHDPGMFSITSAPTIVRGVIVIGHQVLDGQELDAPSGVILAYDAVTGAFKWAWDMRKPDQTGLPPAGQTFSRSTPNMWTTAAGDEQLGLFYIPLGITAGDYWSPGRPAADRQYGTSLVALNAETGKEAWHFQTVHNDVWDYDLGSQPSLVDFPGENGAKVPALILPSKRGDMFVLDRRTGQPLTKIEDRPVPTIGVEADDRAKTQPFSDYHTLAKSNLQEADMWGMSPIDQMICRIEFRSASYQGIFTPPTDPAKTRHWIEYPGYNGGTDWGSAAIDPIRGIIISNYNDTPNYNELVPRADADKRGWFKRDQTKGPIGGAEGAGDPQVGAPYAINVNAGWVMPFTGLLCKQPPYGGIQAIDLKTGKTIWDRPLGSARTNGPFGIPSMLPFTIGTPNNGGPVVTAGGLIFVAATTDNMIRAIDLKSGKTVWSDVLPGGGQATPMTYAVNGKQYLVIMAGGHHFMHTPVSDQLVAYALPDEVTNKTVSENTVK